ncbi:MAG: AAA family ATPase, partial [Chlamydiota bacterium]
IGIQNIEKILANGEYVYIDKTGFAYRLIDEGIPHYFLSRPRRFGKSLFVNTLEHIFKGNKELFKGCQIYESNYDWQKHPVLHFDFSFIENRNPIEFKDSLKRKLEYIGASLKIPVKAPTLQEGLESLVVALSQENRVAVLVDEYDKPIINNLDNLEVAKQNRDLMRDFFGALKGLDQYLKFTFFTGVSKFSQVSIFSGLNNLTDITMNPKYATLMGYTEDEVKRDFKDYVEEIAKARGQKAPSILSQLRKWYNGYRFTEEETSVYNPYSTLRFLSEHKPQGYWYATGTPSFLIEQVKKHPQSIIPLKGAQALKSELSDINQLDDIDLVPLMFQTGYLTITDHREEENSYTLDFPNREVQEAFFNTLLKDFARVSPLVVIREAEKLRGDIESYDLNSFFQTINAHFAKISYQAFSKAKEGFYQAVFFTFLEKSGITTTTEIATNIGRIDLACETNQAICIFELKLDQNADIALTQAETKKYRERFSSQDKPTLVIGVNFSSESRNISDWKGMVFSPEGKLIQKLHPN